ncbi:MAG: ATP/GTP-binding protein [Chitinophagales bacterium]
MLIEFSVTNFRSIKNRQTLSLLPSKRVRERPTKLFSLENYAGTAVLETAVVYGANNTGKSNILKAIRGLQWLVLKSNDYNIGDTIEPNEYFALDRATIQQATVFEIDFVAIDGLRYEYLVEVDSKSIVREELHYYPILESCRLTRRKLYIREQGSSINFGEDLTGERKTIEKQLNTNQLFLSKSANNNQERLAPVYLFFKDKLGVSVFHDSDYERLLLGSLGKFLQENKDEALFTIIETLLNQFDTGIMGLEVHENETSQFAFPENVPDDVRNKFIEQFKFEVKTKHELFDNGAPIGYTTLSLNNQSTGTNKLLVTLGLMLQALKTGDVLVIDELDKSLHPFLTQTIIQLFHQEKTNPNQAQLIFVTHDVTLLNWDLFGKDQVYFIEKDRTGASQLYNLSDIQGVRKTVNLEKWYMSGRFGAVPNVAVNMVKEQVAAYAIGEAKPVRYE